MRTVYRREGMANSVLDTIWFVLQTSRRTEKLESRKAMVEQLVIDHIEKTPTEN